MNQRRARRRRMERWARVRKEQQHMIRAAARVIMGKMSVTMDGVKLTNVADLRPDQHLRQWLKDRPGS